jgi:hypothetical protein
VQPRLAQPRVPVHGALGGESGGGGRTGCEASAQQAAGTRSGARARERGRLADEQPARSAAGRTSWVEWVERSKI